MNSLTQQELHCFKEALNTTETLENIMNHPIMKLLIMEQPEAVQNVKLDWFDKSNGPLDATEQE